MLTRRDSLRLLAGAVVGAAALPARQAAAAAPPARPAIAAGTPPTWTVTGSSSPSLQPFDDLLRSFMEAQSISYASLAVVRQGRLVLARGYNSTSGPVLAQPTSLFRLASVSKPVTATAIMKLVQDGRLSLSAKVAPMLGLSTAADSRLGEVTVLHLLQHLGGWDRSVSFDPMYRWDFAISGQLHVPLPVTQANIMDYTSRYTLDFKPGDRYAYSNYGYMLLGKVVEKVTGLPYATYVQQNVLAPVKITRMVQGRTAQSLRRSSELPYYSEMASATTVLDNSGAQVPMPYGGFNLENMAAHGAWLSSAVDMAKFTTIFDAPGLLTSSSITQVFAPPAINWDGWYYGMGWSVRPVGGALNTWHDGTYPGTSTLMVRRYDKLSWVVLFNRWNDALQQSYTDDIDYPLHQAADQVTSWPDTDLFPSYGL